MKYYIKSSISAVFLLIFLATLSQGISNVQSQSNDSLIDLESTFSGSENSSAPAVASSEDDLFSSTSLSSFFDMPAVTGTYTNNDTGFKITFPNNWTGIQIPLIQDMVMVSPEGIDVESVEEPGTAMTVNTVTEELYAMMEVPLDSNISNATSTGDAVPSNQTDGFLEEEAESCEQQSLPSIVTINNAIAEESIYKCTIEGKVYTTKAYAFATTDNSLIIVSFSGNESTYDAFLPEFENSVKTIEVSNPLDVTKSELYNKYKALSG